MQTNTSFFGNQLVQYSTAVQKPCELLLYFTAPTKGPQQTPSIVCSTGTSLDQSKRSTISDHCRDYNQIIVC